MGGSKIELEPHILPRLMPDKRIYNFQIPRTTPTNGLKKLLFQGVYEVRKGPPLWKWSKIDQLYIFLAKWWIFVGPKVFPPLPQSKWGIVKKNWRVYMYIHARIRKYVTGGGWFSPPQPWIGLNICLYWKKKYLEGKWYKLVGAKVLFGGSKSVKWVGAKVTN